MSLAIRIAEILERRGEGLLDDRGVDRKVAMSIAHEILAAIPRIVVEVEGGVAEVTDCPKGIRVTLIDHDNEEDQQPCSDCNIAVDEEDPYFSTPCGTFCRECMEKHAKECGVCKSEFDL